MLDRDSPDAGTASESIVAVILAEHPEQAHALGEYLLLKAHEMLGFRLLDTRADNSQLLRALIRRYVHDHYNDNAAVTTYPDDPSYCTLVGETQEDDA